MLIFFQVFSDLLIVTLFSYSIKVLFIDKKVKVSKSTSHLANQILSSNRLLIVVMIYNILDVYDTLPLIMIIEIEQTLRAHFN